ncbi:MAG: 4'-phosphopantetheinyl transferase superfamily protein [Aphanocapsa lilacina HA4352-LM1]|jgi:4'-phosphopantetheinyl transferase|nr:4'-phosphopantetheinyl transferase superfamily protein [Aphanocapsa lilacina HA4352-LM1]
MRTITMSAFGRHWPSAPPSPVLAAREVHIWRARLELSDGQLGRLTRVLSADETARARRYVFARDRDIFIARRAVLRMLLGRYLAVPPEGLVFRYGPHGKPALQQSRYGQPIEFNLSYSHGLALFAFSADGPVGIDVEYRRPVPTMEDIARHFFSRCEYAEIASAAPNLRQTIFFNAWTRKEAFLKATGEGLTGLEGVEVSCLPGEAARLFKTGTDPSTHSPWVLREIHPAAGFTAALAYRGALTKIQRWTWSDAYRASGPRATQATSPTAVKPKYSSMGSFLLRRFCTVT